MQSRPSCLAYLLATILGLAGCGAGPAAPPTPSVLRPATSNVAGNWLLLGTLPESLLTSASTTPQLSVTLTTVGDQIVAVGHASVTCPVTAGSTLVVAGLSYSFVANGTVDNDGNFEVASTPPVAAGGFQSTVQLSGTLPLAPGASWSGAYVLDTTTDATCAQKLQGDFTASPIAPISGSYLAAGKLVQGSTQTPFTVTMSLNEGNVSTAATGVAVDDASVLAGSISVKGLSCFSTGTLAPRPTDSTVQRSVEGGTVHPEFSMDDGSVLVVSALIANAQATQLEPAFALVSGGTCASSLGNQLQVGSFVRQN